MTPGADDSARIWFERRKWPHAPHYGHPAWVLGEDELGVWCEVRAGLPWRRGDMVLFEGPFDAIVLVPRLGGFIAWFWTDIDFGELDLYVDIVTGIERSDSEIVCVDLDLDVIRRREDGSVELVDRDEFEAHQQQLGYPEAVVEHAESVAASVLDAVRAQEAPFDGVAAARWHAAASLGRCRPGHHVRPCSKA